MATKYESFLPELLPIVQGCPDYLITSNVRAITVELCERANIYQYELEPVSTVSNIYEYDLEPPADTVVHKILWMTYSGETLEPITSTLLEQNLPKWREDAGYSGTPRFYVQQSNSSFWVAPIPSETAVNAIKLKVLLKPTFTSTVCNDDVMNNYRETIINGTLFRLLRVPNKDWSDMTSSQMYGSMYVTGIDEARRHVERSDGVARKVSYGGIRQRTRYRNRGWREGY